MLVSIFYLNNSSGKLFKSSQKTQVSPFPLEMEGNLTKNNSITRVSLGKVGLSLSKKIILFASMKNL